MVDIMIQFPLLEHSKTPSQVPQVCLINLHSIEVVPEYLQSQYLPCSLNQSFQQISNIPVSLLPLKDTWIWQLITWTLEMRMLIPFSQLIVSWMNRDRIALRNYLMCSPVGVIFHQERNMKNSHYLVTWIRWLLWWLNWNIWPLKSGWTLKLESVERRTVISSWWNVCRCLDYRWMIWFLISICIGEVEKIRTKKR